jgi:hypothetical protein
MQPSNVLRLERLSEDWRDKDSILLHACFQLLKDCVEKENLLTCHIDWDADNPHRHAKAEIEALYQWWLSYKEPTLPDQGSFDIENQMLTRLINVRWALWT